jgi:hypothetical protein
MKTDDEATEAISKVLQNSASMGKLSREQRKARIDNLTIAPAGILFSIISETPSAKAIAHEYIQLISIDFVAEINHLDLAQERLTVGLKRKIESRKIGLLEEVVKAIAAHEDIVLLEAGIYVSPLIDNQVIDTAESKSIIRRCGHKINTEEKAKVDKGIILSRQQEAQLSLRLEQNPYLWDLYGFGEIGISRLPHRTKQTFRDALAIIIFALIQQHAKNDQQRQIGRCKALTAEIISAISPILKTEFSSKIIEHAIY